MIEESLAAQPPAEESKAAAVGQEDSPAPSVANTTDVVEEPVTTTLIKDEVELEAAGGEQQPEPDQKVAVVDSSESEQYSEHIEENEETIDGVQEEEK